MKLFSISALMLIAAAALAAEDVTYYHIHPQWSPDGSRILFYERPGSSMSASILLYDVDSESLTRLTDNEYYDANPVWHPDGEFVVYTSARPNMRGDWQVYQLQIDSGAETKLTHDASRKGHAYVHPEGNAIVFQQVVPNEEDAFKTDVFLLDLDSQQSTRLTATEENEFHPKFGPSAEFIVYDSAVNRMGRLYRYDFDAEKSSQLFEFADDQAAGVPVVSTDGKRVAFSVGTVTEAGMSKRDLAIGDIGTGEYSVLIEAPEGYMIGGATWSPDNRELAFHVSFGSDARIYVYDFDTGRVSPLMADKAFEDVEFGNR